MVVLLKELIYPGKEKVLTGASNDIERATDIARKMVTQWETLKKLGPLLYAEERSAFGRGMSQAKHVSDDTARLSMKKFAFLSTATTLRLSKS